MSETPRIERSNPRSNAALQLLGRWTAAQLSRDGLLSELQKQLKSSPLSAAWDLRLMQRLDHIGAQLLWNHWGRTWPAQLELMPSQRAVLQRVAQLSAPKPQPARLSLWQRFLSLGEIILTVISHFRGFTRLVGQLFIDLIRFAKAPSQAPWRDISGHLYSIGATALPITALVGFLIGVVLAY